VEALERVLLKVIISFLGKVTSDIVYLAISLRI
jgi:hypothetical protein